MVDEQENIMAIRLGYYKEKDYSFIIYSMNKKKVLYQKESKIINVIITIATNTLYKTKDRVLYTELFNDTIFTVTKDGLTPYYVIDFGKRKLPKDLFDDPQPRGIITQLNNPDNQYAGLVCKPQEVSNYLFFSYDFSGKGYTGIYSIESNQSISMNEITFMGKTVKVDSYLFHIQPDNRFIAFLPAYLFSGKGVLKNEQEEEYGNYSDITELLPYLKEDDNPIMVTGELVLDNLFQK